MQTRATISAPREKRQKSRTDRPDWVVKTVQLANGAERREHFDLRGRLQLVEEPDHSSLRYRYGADGQLTAAEHSSGERVCFARTEREMRAVTDRTETIIRFDARGYPDQITLRVGHLGWTCDYERSERGQVEAIRYPQSPDWLHVGAQLRCGSELYVDAAPPLIRFANGTTAREEWTPGGPPLLSRIAHADAEGIPVIDMPYEHEPSGRLARAGDQRFGYDEAGRLTECDARRYAFDERGRMTQAGTEEFRYAASPAVISTNSGSFEYDALGRRIAKLDAREITRYTYNLFGQLASVTLPDGSVIRYIYDGFGRLVGRETAGSTVYYVVDFEGHRLAECDETGNVRRSYLWLGLHCVGSIDGACGAPLSRSFHRVHGGTLAGMGDAHGRIEPVAHADPYGSDAPIVDGIPGFACLFGDPATGLLFATSRWLDPALCQFITSDSWHGTHAIAQLPRGLRSVFDRMPGGTGRLLDAQSAYSFCGYDPVNYCDPSGHSVIGIIWGIISAFLWQMQVTSVALQMEVISLALWLVLTFPGFMFLWGNDFWKNTNPFNAIAPLLGSTRLNVPFAFPLNSIWNASGAVFTMGSVIWVRGEQLETLEKTAQRDLLICSNAQQYQSAVEAAAADTILVRSPHAKATATTNAAGDQLTAVAVTTPPGETVANVFEFRDTLSIRLPPPSTAGDEIRKANNIVGNVITLDAPLPAAMQGQAVVVTRMDRGFVRIQKDDNIAARTIAFVRGQALHFQNPVPENVPASGLTVTEYMRSGKRRKSFADSAREAFLVRVAAADHALYAANDFIRVRAGAKYFARMVARKRGTRDLVLDNALPNPATPTEYVKIEVVKLDPGATAAAQAATGTRVDAGNLNDLVKFDGLAIENTGGAPAVTTERRIVTQVFLRFAIPALPAALHAVPIGVDLMTADTSKKADGTVTAADTVTTTKDHAKRFEVGQPVRVRKAPSTDFFTTVKTVNNASNLLAFDDALPAADFPNTTAVSVVLMVGGKRFDAEPSAAPGDRVLMKVDKTDSPKQNDIIRIRKAADTKGGALRTLAAAGTVVAEVDSALPATHAANLTVRRFAPVKNTLRENAAAPLVQIRFTIPAGAVPYVQNDELHFSAGEEGWGKVLAAPVGQDFFLVDPIENQLNTAGIEVEHITITGRSTPDGKLEESLILIPSDPDEAPITRRRAVEAHEMRHVWQYAVLGPFFFSMPIPWLVNLGFSFTDNANEASKWIRHFSVGAVDSLFAAIAWGIGTGGRGPTSLQGEVSDAARKVVTFAADTDAAKFADFADGSPCDVIKGDYDTFNIIETFDAGQKKITLRFPLEEDRFAVNDQVKVTVSPFEKIRSTVNKWFSLNLERLWSDHIPQSWGRALSKFLNRDSWFPLLGLYPIAFLRAKSQGAVHFEQDASYHSGDLYTNFAVSNPNEIFVGQFSRLLGFLQGRGAGDTAVGLSDNNQLTFMRVQTPFATAADAVASVGGAVSMGGATVRFRENYYIPMHDKVENAVGAFFVASRPGDYVVRTAGELPDADLLRTISFDADFHDLRKIKVKPLGVTPVVSAAKPLFETQQVNFQIAGDPSVTYVLRYKGAPPVPEGAREGLRFTAPVLPGAAVVHTLEILATYRADHPIFKGGGQSGDARLTAEQLTNVCQELVLNISPLAAPVVASVKAGTTRKFPMPIAPATITVTSALPAGAAVNASVLISTVGPPAELTFIAPNAVTAATNVTFDMVFGAGAATRTITTTVQVTP